MRYRKRPVEVEAVQWDGSNLEEVQAFTGPHFAPMTDKDREDWQDPGGTGKVYDKLHKTWVMVYDGDYIICGVQGEYYPCREAVFRETYEPA